MSSSPPANSNPADNTSSGGTTSPTAVADLKGEKKKKTSFIPRIFSSKRNSTEISDDILQPDADADNLKHQNDLDSSNASTTSLKEPSPAFIKRGFSERLCSHGIESLNISSSDASMAPDNITKEIRVFVGTWNLGGNSPSNGLNIEDFLQVESSADIYVLGFQEMVPLNAGNVLVMEDNEPASKWMALIHHTLNKPYNEGEGKEASSTILNNPSSLKALGKTLRGENHLLKACNCSSNGKIHYWHGATDHEVLSLAQRLNYQVVASKQMVGLFLCIWARRELITGIGHLRISCIGRGILGYLGNKGCIAISMTVQKTSFCFVCSHLASGEKEGDELRRNCDVAEILKGTHFPKICENDNGIPEKILDHERIVWLGDLNYRVAMSYEETKVLLEDNNWDSLLAKDQLIREREAGRVFQGWKEGKITFAPTYKYTHNSDSYAGANCNKRKRRTPAWCDRILWRGDGIQQLCYIRRESRFSDHRPVCALFSLQIQIQIQNDFPAKPAAATGLRLRKGYSCAATHRDFQINPIPRPPP
ncbi:type I inositol polyphosphate 5-phosphatase 5-like [Andrographis paniculata]|uniref:type I inositol polyphosphate 5-phosphatase 5-like n=1 Tax=Andrographis paniculata TaxID=175694 RepID=UPI0021E9A3F2|nr:type I inositol polyphosphate 5-phosphatase 5-like [Andrographis paniculata]